MDFEKFVKQEARMECLKILKIMEQHDLTFQQVVYQLLKQHKATEKVLQKF